MNAQRNRRNVFWLQIVYLAILGTLAGLYFGDVFEPPKLLGSIPVSVPWFGALGAVLLSLSGVFTWRDTWDVGYRYWHYARPAVGAALGSISALILQSGVLAVGSNPKTADPNKDILYYLISFLVGYREEAFRSLIRTLSDTILKSADAASMSISTLTPVEGNGGTHVTIVGKGLTKANKVQFGDERAFFKVTSDTMIVAEAPPAPSPTGPVRVSVASDDTDATGLVFTYPPKPSAKG